MTKDADLVARLREMSRPRANNTPFITNLCAESADAIEHLQADLAGANAQVLRAAADLGRLRDECERLQAEVAALRARALEEAAQACEREARHQGTIGRQLATQDCAAAIRALKDKPT